MTAIPAGIASASQPARSCTTPTCRSASGSSPSISCASPRRASRPTQANHRSGLQNGLVSCHRIRSMGNDPFEGPTLFGSRGGRDPDRPRGLQGQQDLGCWGNPARRGNPPEGSASTPSITSSPRRSGTKPRRSTPTNSSPTSAADHNTRHGTVNHSIDEWVVGPYQHHRRRLEPVQAEHHWELPQGQREAS